MGLAHSRIDLSLLQHQSTSQEKHRRLRITRHFPHQSTGYLRTRLRLVSFTPIYSCMCITLYETLYDRPFSVTSEDSLRDSEPPDISLLGTRAPMQGTGDFMRSECVKLVLVSFTLIYTHCQLHVHYVCHLALMFAWGTCAS